MDRVKGNSEKRGRKERGEGERKEKVEGERREGKGEKRKGEGERRNGEGDGRRVPPVRPLKDCGKIKLQCIIDTIF